MNLVEEFEKYKREYDLGSIESDVRLVSTGDSWWSQRMISFTFRTFSRVIKINFHYSIKKENFSLILIRYGGNGSSESEWKAILNINRISIGEYKKFPRMSIEECFNFVERIIQGLRDRLDPVVIDKNLQIYMKLMDINKEFR